MRMIWKTSRNEKHKYFDEETLPHSEKKKHKCSHKYCPGG